MPNSVQASSQGWRHLAAAIQADFALNGYVNLYQNDFTPVGNDLLASFDQCDFDGDTQLQPSFSSPPILDIIHGYAVFVSDPMTFFHFGGEVGNDVYGWFFFSDVLGAGERGCICSKRFDDAPKAMVAEGDSITITITVRVKTSVF